MALPQTDSVAKGRIGIATCLVLAPVALLASCTSTDETVDHTTTTTLAVVETVAEPLDLSASAPAEGEWTQFEDDSAVATVSFDIPASWDDTDAYDLVTGAPDVDVAAREIEVSPQLEEFGPSYTIPGIKLRISESSGADTYDEVESSFPNEDCLHEGIGEVEAEHLNGYYNSYTQCAGGTTAYWDGVLELGDHLVRFEAVSTDSESEAAVVQILATLAVA